MFTRKQIDTVIPIRIDEDTVIEEKVHKISGDNSGYEAELLGAYLSKGQEGRHYNTSPEQADI